LKKPARCERDRRRQNLPHYTASQGKTMLRQNTPRKPKARPTLHLARCPRCQRPALRVRGRVQCLRCGDAPLFQRERREVEK